MSHPNTVTENGITLTIQTPTITQIVPWHEINGLGNSYANNWVDPGYVS
jgi:hypothetical protein